MKYPKTLENLIESFKKLPGIGEKTAERYALSLLELDKEYVDLMIESLSNLKKIKRCVKCNNLTEESECSICKSQERDKNTICIVESPKNLVILEKLSVYNGMYYVLDKLISPLDGIGPEDINLDLLLKRIKTEEIKEVIFAIKPDIEGETTIRYISKILEKQDIKITRLAHGVPIGIEMEYIDSMTLELAFEDRQSI